MRRPPQRAVLLAVVGGPGRQWQFDGDFVVYDIPRDRWVRPIREARVPTGTPASPAEVTG